MALCVGCPAGAALADGPKWAAHTDIEAKLSTGRNLGEIGFFMPVTQNDTSLLFADIRFRPDDQGSREGNFGLGLRHMLESGWNIGAYGYLDIRRTGHGNTFTQVTAGLEALSPEWSLRANAYLPVGSTSQDVNSLDRVEISGTSVIFRGGAEHAMYGVDAEIGYRLPMLAPELGASLDLYGGAYHFQNRASGAPDITGARGRMELVFEDPSFLPAGGLFALGGEIQHDGPRGTQGALTARLRIPLGGERSGLTQQEKRMTAPVVRDVDIVTLAGTFTAPETVTQLADGSAFTVLNSQSTVGHVQLQNALNNAGNNSTVLLVGDFHTSGLITTAFGQTLTGQLTVRTSSGKAALVTSGASITSTNATRTIEVESGSTISNLTINASLSGGLGGPSILVGDNKTGVTIANNAITLTQSGNNAGVGVLFGLNASGAVTGNHISVIGTGTATAMTALGVNTGAPSVLVSGNTLSAAGGTSQVIVRSGAGTTFLPASTGNVRLSGNCNGGSLGGSAVHFTDGSTCP